MKCELKDREQKLDDFLLGKMTPENSEAFEIHAFSCPECLDELRMREQMVRVMREENTSRNEREKSQTTVGVRKDVPARPLAKRVQKRWIYFSAAAALLIAILLLNRPSDLEKTDLRFQVSPYLESILTQTFQSSDVSVANVSPRLGANVSGDVLFQWRAQRSAQDFVGDLALKILDNKENVVHSITVRGSQYLFENALEPGLYYWTLEDQGQMIYLGKFLVSMPDN